MGSAPELQPEFNEAQEQSVREKQLEETNEQLQEALSRSVSRRDAVLLAVGAAVAGVLLTEGGKILYDRATEDAIEPDRLAFKITKRSVEGYGIRYDKETFVEETLSGDPENYEQYPISYGQIVGEGNVIGLRDGERIMLPTKRDDNGNVTQTIDSGISVHNYPSPEGNGSIPMLKIHLNTTDPELPAYIPMLLTPNPNFPNNASVVEFINPDMPEPLKKIPVSIGQDLENDSIFSIEFKVDSLPSPQDRLFSQQIAS